MMMGMVTDDDGYGSLMMMGMVTDDDGMGH